jgi:predicted ATPase/DNA-binding SARP family transcriptional activator/Tfp pilus assembly protein PilF
MSRLTLYFLGTPRLELDGTAITLSHHKALALLAYLAVTRQPHTRQALAALLWPDYDPTAARGEVRRMLWVLNKSLGQGWLEVDRETVLLPSQPDLWLDIEQFRKLLAVGHQHGHPAGEVCPACLEPLTEAVALARGDFMAGFSLADSPDFDTWQTFETESLYRELAGALERLVQLLSQQREALDEQAITYARRWLALDPLHEPAHRQLMQLYAWSGQPAAAMRQYQVCVRVLKEELGILPSAETTALYEAIKANRLPPPPSVAAPPAHSVAEGQTLSQNLKPGMHETEALAPTLERALPAQPTPFIGRQQEVAAVRTLLTQDTSQVRLVTLTGPGGTGKTRLGLQVAAELQDCFADGVFFVPLASLSDPQLLASTIARQLDVREGGSQPVLQLLKSALQEKHLLLVLDNFEQIVTAAPVIAELLAAAPRLKVLVTSRALLHLRGEYEFLVPPLSLPEQSQAWSMEELRQSEAIQLFIERAQATAAGFTLTTENAAAVVEICRRLDGLPLAIELAAARIKLLPPQTLLTRLSNRLKLLTGGAQDMPARQQTLRNTIEWSYSLLDQAEQILFSRLAIFVGGFTLETAEAICSAGNSSLDILEGVTSLLNKSLLVPQDSSGDEPRFRMLETIREYALERLVESGQLETLQQQHALFFLVLAEAAKLEVRGPQEVAWLDRLDAEHDNLRAALDWSTALGDRVEIGLRLAEAMWRLWWVRGYWGEGRRWLEALLARTSARTSARASILDRAGRLARKLSDYQAARAYHAESLAIWRTLGDQYGIADALDNLGAAAWSEADYTGARRLHEESLAIWRTLDDPRGIAITLGSLGLVAWNQGDYATARQLHEESLAIRRELGDQGGISNSLNNLGAVALDQGDYAAARALLEASLAIRRELGDRWGIAQTFMNLGVVALNQGDAATARALYEKSLAIRRELGARSGIAMCLNNLGEVAWFQGEYATAQALHAESLAIRRELGEKNGIAWSLNNLGLVALDQGDAAAAQALHAESLAIQREVGEKNGIAACLAGLARVALAQAQPERATYLLGAAAALLEAIGGCLDVPERAAFDRSVATVRTTLGERLFAEAWGAGRTMPLEQAIAEALHAANELNSTEAQAGPNRPAPSSPA